MLIIVHSGRPSGVIGSQLSPPFREMCTSPSSEPTQNTPRSCGDSANANIVQYVSAPDVSLTSGPPDGACFAASSRVRSGLICSQLFPSSVDRNSTLAATYSTLGSCGEYWIGKVHWKRYFIAPAPEP